MEIRKLIAHPVRLRILQRLQVYGPATTKELADALKDVPAATLYRHVETLLSAGLLTVREERQIRGSRERLLAVDTAQLGRLGGEQSLSSLAWQLFGGLSEAFARYEETPGADPVRDMLMLRTCMLELTDEDYESFLRELAALLNRYATRPAGGGEKTRSFTVISAPVCKEKKEE